MSTGYIREWRPLLDFINHVQRVRALSINEACGELLPALYEGKVKARFAGVRYETFQDDGVEPSEWARPRLFSDGSVKFAPTLQTPVGLGVRRHQIEVCWADVLRHWPEPKPLKTKISALQSWMVSRYGGDGPPPRTTAKTIARDFEAETKTRVDARTVRRALGGR